MNKKIFLSLLLVLLIAVSVSAVSAEAIDDAVLEDSAIDDVVLEDSAVDDVAAVEEPIAEDSNILTDDPVDPPAPTYTADAIEIQTLIDNAENGGTVNLENKTYNVGEKLYTLNKKLTINGNGATIAASGAIQGDTDALFTAKQAGTTFNGITFINTDGHKNYGEPVSGYAIQMAIENGTVNNCKFIDWNSGVYGKGAAFCTISNSYFNGSSWEVTGAGKNEKGTKAINLMGSHDINVTGCTFEGQVLDGISIASNSGNNIMTNNIFIENVYAIYFGGKSTQGCVIANNTFIRCGYCPDVSEAINKKVTVLSTQKACSGFIIADNDIEAVAGTTFIKMESGNTAHGYPSEIGDINITGNTLTVAEGAIPSTITFIHILSNAGPLSPYAPIAITGNNIAAGITPVFVWYADWDSGNDIVIGAAEPVPTILTITDVNPDEKFVVVKLTQINGSALAGVEISYMINGLGDPIIVDTDEEGLCNISLVANCTVDFAYAGGLISGVNYAPSTTGLHFVLTRNITQTVIEVHNHTVYVNASSGDVVAEPEIVYVPQYVEVPTYIEVLKNNTVYVNNTVEVEKVVTKTVTKTISPKATALTVPKKTYKAKKTKKITATLKSGGKALAGQKVTFFINGKKITKTTNKKGVATATVKISKKGTYHFTAYFAGNNNYKSISKAGKLIVKK